MDQDLRECIKERLMAEGKDIFVEGHEIDDKEVLGILVSKYCEWDGNAIMKVFLDALEDANFHTLRGQIEELWRKDG